MGFVSNPTSGGTTEGFGRLDALNRIGNTVFGDDLAIKANFVPTTAPVAFPHIWDTSWFRWVQYNGSIEQPMVRNVGEAMGVSALINFHGSATPRFTSSVPVGRIHDPIEMSLRGATPPLPARAFSGLRSPQWPGNILPPVNQELAARGARVYQERCRGCHLPAPNSEEFWTSNAWTPPNSAGERYLDLPMIPISTIGTDPEQAQNMLQRTVLVPSSFGLARPIGREGNLTRHGYADALSQIVERVINRWYDSQQPPTSAADRDRMNGHRPNGFRALLEYRARPLNGVWATAPYLHNGSVPTLWHLLSPSALRPRTFSLGTTRFDPVHVGYANAGSFTLDTTQRGNSNGGHLFETLSPGAPPLRGRLGDTIPEADRWALIEFLKTL